MHLLRISKADAGPMTYNTLPNNLRDPSNLRTIVENTFSLPIITFSALGVSHVMRYIYNKTTLPTYLFTYYLWVQLACWMLY